MVEWLNQNVGFVTAILGLVNLLIACFLAFIAYKTAKIANEGKEISKGAKEISGEALSISQKQLDKIVEIEQNRARPYVLFNIISSNDRIYQSQIKNYGLTVALDVEVSIEPSLMVFDHEEVDTLSFNKIFSLPPNFEITSDINSSWAFFERYPNPVFSGTITYKNLDGNVYSELFSIDLNFMKRKISHDEDSIAKELKRLTDEIRTVSRELKRIGTTDK